MSLEGNAEKNTLLQKLSGKIRYVPELDETLTHPDKAANAKAVGDAIARVEGKADMMVPNVSKNVTYNGAKSGLNAVNTQDAIDEVAAKCKISDWIDANLQPSFASYAGTSPTRYRKVGNVVEVLGIVTPTSDLESSNAMHTIFTVDVGFRPVDTLSVPAQGSSAESWLLTVGSDGKISASRYRDANGYKKFTAGVWMPFHITYLVE